MGFTVGNTPAQVFSTNVYAGMGANQNDLSSRYRHVKPRDNPAGRHSGPLNCPCFTPKWHYGETRSGLRDAGRPVRPAAGKGFVVFTPCNGEEVTIPIKSTPRPTPKPPFAVAVRRA
jgi:hypothetical protein